MENGEKITIEGVEFTINPFTRDHLDHVYRSMRRINLLDDRKEKARSYVLLENWVLFSLAGIKEDDIGLIEGKLASELLRRINKEVDQYFLGSLRSE